MRIGIVNDLPIALEALRRCVEGMPGCRVAWQATDGAEAVSRCAVDRPDLVLMDLIMPRMDGVEATRRIMRETPCPILVVTATVSGNAARTFEALGEGALDAIDTPSVNEPQAVEALRARIRMIERVTRSDRESSTVPLPTGPVAGLIGGGETVALLGASTGGPNAVATVLQSWPRPLPFAAVVVQHLDADFVAGLADWLCRTTGHSVRLAKPGDRPEAGTVWLAGGTRHLGFDPLGRFVESLPRPEDLHHPSVDAMFTAAAGCRSLQGCAALLTGMGRDGATGLLTLRRAGWSTIAQDRASSVVWGMPGTAVRLGAAERIIPLAEIGHAMLAAMRQPKETRT